MSQLFSTYSVGDLLLKNRIVIAPMCQYSAENGSATDWHLIHLGHLALSGCPGRNDPPARRRAAGLALDKTVRGSPVKKCG